MGRPKVSDTIWINYIALDEDLWEAVHQYDSGHQIAQLCGTRLEVVAWARARRAVSKLIFSVVEEDFVPLADMYEAPPEGEWGSAIFLHLWRGPRRPTAGCIAFRRRDLEWILARWNPRRRVVVTGWARGA